MAQDKLFKYLPVSAVDRQWGLFVCTTGTDRVRPGVNYPLPGHPEGYAFSWERGRVLHEYQIVYIIAGKGVFESRQTGLCAVSAGDALILRPGDWHRYRPDEGTGWHEYWVGFSGTYALQLMRQDVFKSGAPVLHPGLRENLIMLFQQLLDVAADEPPGFRPVLAATTMQIIASVRAALFAQDGNTQTEQLMRSAKELMLERLDQPLDMKAVAQQLKVGYSWFRHAFRTHTGLSPHQYHLQLRLNRAESLLRATDRSIKEIAQMTGFECAFYFSRLFKAKRGQAPQHFRKPSKQMRTHT